MWIGTLSTGTAVRSITRYAVRYHVTVVLTPMSPAVYAPPNFWVLGLLRAPSDRGRNTQYSAWFSYKLHESGPSVYMYMAGAACLTRNSFDTVYIYVPCVCPPRNRWDIGAKTTVQRYRRGSFGTHMYLGTDKIPV